MKPVAAVISAGIALVLCSGTARADVRIGVTLPLTGFMASYGEDARHAVELAVEQANAAGGVKGEKVEAVIEDDGGVGKTGVAATQKLIGTDKVPVIIGGMMSGVALTGAPIARAAQVVYISTMSSHPDLTSPGGFIYRLEASDNAYAAIEVEYFSQNLKAKTAAGLFSGTEYGTINGKNVRADFEKQGGKWLLSETFQPGAADFRTQIAKLKEQQPDVVFIVATHKEAAQMLRQMVELNFKPPVMGTGMLDDPAIFELAGAAANGVYFTTSVVAATDSTRKLSDEFRAAFKAKYNRDPGITATSFYDATRLAIDAIRNAGPSGPAIDKWIAGVKDYPSVTANISFTDIGDRILPLTIKRIDGQKFVGTDLVRSPQ